MQIETTQFGSVAVEAADIIHFPSGLFGLERHCHWILLADAENEALAWMQSASDPDMTLAVVSPRRFVPHYQVRIRRDELAPLGLTDMRQAHVLTVVGKNERSITLNLKAPLILNLARRLGRQVVVTSDETTQYELDIMQRPLRKSA